MVPAALLLAAVGGRGAVLVGRIHADGRPPPAGTRIFAQADSYRGGFAVRMAAERARSPA